MIHFGLRFVILPMSADLNRCTNDRSKLSIFSYTLFVTLTIRVRR